MSCKMRMAHSESQRNGEILFVNTCIVHHLVYNYISPYFERLFIADSCIGARLRGRPEVVVRAEIVERPVRIAVAGKETWRESNRLNASHILVRMQEVRIAPETYHLKMNK